MNQKSRQTATSPVERDFFKPLNNSNFAIDFRFNIITVFLSHCTMILQKFRISNILQQYSVTIPLEISFSQST